MGDILLASGEIMTRRMVDMVHMALPMVDYGAPSSVLQGLNVLKMVLFVALICTGLSLELKRVKL